MLAILPVLTASRSVLFKALRSENSAFNSSSPIFVAQFILFVGLSAYTAGRYGRQEAMLMFSRRYCAFSILGLVGGCHNIISFLALRTRLSSAVQVVLLKTGVLWAALLQVQVIGMEALGVGQLLTVGAVLVPVAAYSLGEADLADMDVLGFSLGLVSGFTLIMQDHTQEVLMVSFRKAAADGEGDPDAEVSRCMAMGAFFTMVTVLIASFVLQALEDGGVDDLNVLRGWDIEVFVYAVVPTVLRWPVKKLTVYYLGTLRVSLVESLDCAVAYFLSALLGLSGVVVTSALQVTGIVLIIAKNESDKQHLQDEVLRAKAMSLDRVLQVSRAGRFADFAATRSNFGGRRSSQGQSET